jgi:hypothetical protein
VAADALTVVAIVAGVVGVCVVAGYFLGFWK